MAMARVPGTRTFNYTYMVEVKGFPQGSARLNMWIPYPQSNADQIILDVKVDSPYPVSVGHEPKYGNAYLFLTVNHPRKSFTLKATYTVRRLEKLAPSMDYKKNLSAQDKGEFQKFLVPSKYAVINDTVRNFSAEATAGKTGTLEKVKGIYDFIVRHMDYNKKIPGFGNGDVERACIMISDKGEGAGNCTDFHSLFASMARVQHIPVKFEMGYPLAPTKDLTTPRAGGYHCWAKFFVAGLGWLPVDISEARKHKELREYYWGSLDDNRIKFSEGRDIRLPGQESGASLNYFGPDPYLELDGRPFKGFKRFTTYKNL